jgi:hypothetical protein
MPPGSAQTKRDRRTIETMTSRSPLRRALFGLLAAALLAPAMAVPAAPAAPAPGCEMGDSCPLAAASACPTMECCAAPAAPPRPLPLDEATPAAGPQLVAPAPAPVALVVPPPPRPRPAAGDRPLHGTGAPVPLFTLHAAFLI